MAEWSVDLADKEFKEFLAHVKETNPKLVAGMRKALRTTADEILSEQRAILRGPKPGSVRKTGQRATLIHPKNGRSSYVAMRNVYEYGDDSSDGNGSMRENISRGLTVKISNTKTMAGVNLKTTKRIAPVSISWERGLFRHPVFQREGRPKVYAYQRGQPYFWSPVKRGYIQVRQRVSEVIDDVLQQLAE